MTAKKGGEKNAALWNLALAIISGNVKKGEKSISNWHRYSITPAGARCQEKLKNLQRKHGQMASTLPRAQKNRWQKGSPPVFCSIALVMRDVPTVRKEAAQLVKWSQDEKKGRKNTSCYAVIIARWRQKVVRKIWIFSAGWKKENARCRTCTWRLQLRKVSILCCGCWTCYRKKKGEKEKTQILSRDHEKRGKNMIHLTLSV